MQYLADQREAKSIAFVTFVGDIVQHGDGRFRIAAVGDAPARIMDTRAEWDIANRAVSILSRSGVPFGMSPGNHDYDNYSWWAEPGGPGASRPLSGGRAWGFYFGPTSHHFAGRGLVRRRVRQRAEQLADLRRRRAAVSESVAGDGPSRQRPGLGPGRRGRPSRPAGHRHHPRMAVAQQDRRNPARRQHRQQLPPGPITCRRIRCGIASSARTP